MQSMLSTSSTSPRTTYTQAPLAISLGVTLVLVTTFFSASIPGGGSAGQTVSGTAAPKRGAKAKVGDKIPDVLKDKLSLQTPPRLSEGLLGSASWGLYEEASWERSTIAEAVGRGLTSTKVGKVESWYLAFLREQVARVAEPVARRFGAQLRDDVVQEVMTDFIRIRGSTPILVDGAAEPYVAGAVKYKSKTLLHRQNRRREAERTASIEHEVLDGSAMFGSLLDRLQHRAILESLREYASILPPSQQKYLLSRLDGELVREIAAAYGVKASAVTKGLKKALQHVEDDPVLMRLFAELIWKIDERTHLPATLKAQLRR